METYIALLRGINVGGKNMVKMAELKAMLSELGFEDVQILLQSGNVVFRAKKSSREALEKRLREESEKRLGCKAEYFVRTREEWSDLIEKNPFPEMAKEDPSHLLAVLLKSAPSSHEVAEMQKRIKGPEQIRAGSEHFYITYPEGIGTSTVVKTPGWNKMVGVGTGRNWNTVLKLAEMATKP